MMNERMATTSRYATFFAGALIALLAGCDDTQPCAVPGSVEACACAPSMPGARLCEAEHTWGQCDCSGAIPLPNPVVPSSGGVGGMGGSGGSSGTGGAGAGGSGAGGVGGSGSGGGGGAGGIGDDDGGIDPDGGATGGTGGMEPDFPYGPCMVNDDCQPNADCSITPNTPMDSTVCAPKCVDVVDCPKPEGMYDATIQCVTGYCRIDCTPVLFEPLLSCPLGMVCVAPLFGQAYCHDDPAIM